MTNFTTCLTLAGLLTITACSSTTNHKTVSHKEVYSKNLVPHFLILDVPSPEKSSDLSEDELEAQASEHTNKRLYFLTLYSQYESLKAMTSDESARSINVCPSFHNSLLNHKESQSSKELTQRNHRYQYDMSKISEENYLVLHPELLLPTTMEATNPRVIDLVKNKTSEQVQSLVSGAMKIHLAKTYNELKELCEFGESDNYYSYENLITHIQSKSNFSRTHDNLKVLMKTTLFSNLMLINAMDSTVKGRAIASVPKENSYTKEVSARIGADWADHYFKEVKRLRKQAN